MSTARAKPYLLYYVHAHGAGHLATFRLLLPKISEYFTVIALTTHNSATKVISSIPDLVVYELPAKWPDTLTPPAHTFSRAFEETPYDRQPSKRVVALLEIVQKYRPVAFYCDGSPELAIVARGMGVPVVLVHLPGNTSADPTQVFAYELSDHIVAHFPQLLESKDYAYMSKTYFSGYMSRYAGTISSSPIGDGPISILLGFDNYNESLLQTITANKHRQFTIIGNTRDYDLASNVSQLGRVDDIARAITGNVVITAAGQNSVAELLSLNRQLIVLPEPRPYDEQHVHAKALARYAVAHIADHSFSTQAWDNIIIQANSNTMSHADLVNSAAPTEIATKLKEWYV